ncbi:MAG TPA: hypothetical protein VFW33_10635 [Gemmataceae bacterium]|nr:hypothetical protein [Gemmataceae bacterium]
MSPTTDTAEIVQTVERLRGEFDDLAVRGLRPAGPEHLATLDALCEEFRRIGAEHLAGLIVAVVEAIRGNDRDAARALLRAQASLRVFERVLTLESTAEILAALAEPPAGEAP